MPTKLYKTKKRLLRDTKKPITANTEWIQILRMNHEAI